MWSQGPVGYTGTPKLKVVGNFGEIALKYILNNVIKAIMEGELNRLPK